MEISIDQIKQTLGASEHLLGAMQKYHSVSRDYGTGDLLFSREVHFLMVLGRADTDLFIGDIAQALGITHGAVSQLAERLEKKNLIIRHKSNGDQRKIISVLTAKGRKVFQKHESYDQKAFQRVLERCVDCSNEELETFVKVAVFLTECYESFADANKTD